MGLYIGSQPQKLVINNQEIFLELYTPNAIVTNGIRLKSFDDYILKDENGYYLTIKEGE